MNSKSLRPERRPDRRVLLRFTRQMRVFAKAGIPVGQAIGTIVDEMPQGMFRAALLEVLEDLDRGDMLSASLQKHSKIFPPYFVSLVRSAEATGAFVETLESLIAHQSRVMETRSKITSALAYPCIVMTMALVTVAILAGFVIPRFEPLFEELGSTLPVATRLLLNSTKAVTSNAPAIALLIIVSIGGFAAALRSSRARRIADRLLLKLPIVGNVVEYALLERFCRMFAATIRSGLPVTAGMRLSAQTVGNSALHDLLSRATQDMTMGIGFANALTRTGLFPGAARQMFRVGEETGALEEQLAAVGEFFDSELEIKLRRFTALFEPLLIVFVGLVVGFVAIALVSAMYGVLDGVRELS